MDNKINNKNYSPTINPTMKKYTILFGAVCSVVLAFSQNAQALAFGDGNDLGQVLFGIPSGDAARTSYVNHLISLAPNTTGDTFQGQTFNRTGVAASDFGLVSFPTAVFGKNGTGNTNINLGTGLYSYLFAKYDGKNAGSEVWYVGNLSGIISIPAQGLAADVNAGHGYGLSGWTLFGPGGVPHTPDGGATAALLGLGLAGLAGLRAKFGRN
jgi:VPDSG-CTERM motif